ncbi:branched-chain amino acid transport system II carrier protein [Cytobacillus sp. S13-E01]|uniref:branched-chain amino acid transport system II carrier protein n=1 Tax=Cytobacillus sp. S13-E01 TaxID=3031326 RepID=UPI0023D7FCF1|nr:branched-chain amino acid transport system II carrier protein [Cytobacillus sp. S13-E01]MDF0726437.1 branched-chain amino acid transport system II carrier protein [Cytobacillus sp. S13-E01]
MNEKVLTGKEIVTIGLMLFALFLGAGNLIFPPALGQAAGTNIWIAIAGFLITGVGLPLLGVIAIAHSGGDLQLLANRVHPVFGLIFTITMYMAIGPFFGIPRTGTVAFEIGIVPFLPDEWIGGTALFIYSIIFFGITYFLSLNPSKLVDRIGKVLTPILLLVIGLLVVKAVMSPMGIIQNPKEGYQTSPFFKGFIDGYLTMDTIAALVFGIVVISSIKEKGITDKRILVKACTKAGIIAASGLAIVYVSLSYLGASSVESIGYSNNGGEILSASSKYLYGSLGSVILSIAITFACLTTSIGLVSSTAKYFATLSSKLSYNSFVAVFSLFSMVIANVGLSQLITISVPVLIFIYPLAIVLIALSFAHSIIKDYKEVYSISLIGTGLVSLFDGLKSAGIDIDLITNLFSRILPLYEQGIGWLMPAIVGAILGFILAKTRR